MPFMTISKAISSGIQRNVAVSELKHNAKLDTLKRELAIAQLQRASTFGRKLTEARSEHAMWEAGLTPEQVVVYNQSLIDIEAIVNPAKTSD
jgi:hypothetical protein